MTGARDQCWLGSVAVLVAFAVGCGSAAGGAGKDAAADAPDASAETGGSAGIEAGEDADADTDTGAVGDADCDPSCHWDCSGGMQCESGQVWMLGIGPFPCCHWGDPWPPDPGGPVCAAELLRSCASGQCATQPDPRYDLLACLDRFENPADPGYGDLAPTLCSDPLPGVGDACKSAADCRPSADGKRLHCDLPGEAGAGDGAVGKCVSEPRPPGPADYGGSCGLPDTYADAGAVLDGVVQGATCQHCQVYRANAGDCLKQACTIPCRFDEDCPSGSICLCFGQDLPRFCAAATDRSTVAGRTAGLACP